MVSCWVPPSWLDWPVVISRSIEVVGGEEMRREVWQPTHDVHASRKSTDCHLVPRYAFSEIWIMQLSPLWEDGCSRVGVVSLWEPELLGRFCQSKDSSPNCTSSLHFSPGPGS